MMRLWKRFRQRTQPEGSPTRRIRGMRFSDLSKVLEIEKQVYEFPWPRRAFEDCLRLGYYCVLVCERKARGEERLCGYGIMDAGGEEAHICNVSVAEGHQRQGIGRFLMEALLSRAKGRGAKGAYLEVRPSNLRAQVFYRALGFHHAGTRRGYYQASIGVEDAWVFRAEIAA